MTKQTDWTMRAGRGDETVHGWVYRQTLNDQTSHTWLQTPSRAIAFGTVRSKEGIDWCRAYTMENGVKVVLA